MKSWLLGLTEFMKSWLLGLTVGVHWELTAGTNSHNTVFVFPAYLYCSHLPDLTHHLAATSTFPRHHHTHLTEKHRVYRNENCSKPYTIAVWKFSQLLLKRNIIVGVSLLSGWWDRGSAWRILPVLKMSLEMLGYCAASSLLAQQRRGDWAPVTKDAVEVTTEALDMSAGKVMWWQAEQPFLSNKWTWQVVEPGVWSCCCCCCLKLRYVHLLTTRRT